MEMATVAALRSAGTAARAAWILRAPVVAMLEVWRMLQLRVERRGISLAARADAEAARDPLAISEAERLLLKPLAGLPTEGAWSYPGSARPGLEDRPAESHSPGGSKDSARKKAENTPPYPDK